MQALSVPGGQGGVLTGYTMMNTGPNAQVSSGIALNGSLGYGNYNAGFASVKMADWRGLTMQSNFTYSKALGTGADVQASSEYTPDDPFNLGTTYGYQNYDRKFVYNLFFVYQLPFYKGQSGLMGRALGGWSFASVFTAGSGHRSNCIPRLEMARSTEPGTTSTSSATKTRFRLPLLPTATPITTKASQRE